MSDQRVVEVRCRSCGEQWVDPDCTCTCIEGQELPYEDWVTVDPHYPESVMVWTDGNHHDAVVIYREWQAYQRRYMEANQELRELLAEFDGLRTELEHANQECNELRSENERLRAAVLDIDAHAKRCDPSH